MSIFQKRVDSLIKKELDALKKAKREEAEEIHKKETTQAKINRLLEEQKMKENKKND